jgi:O-antigen ligase
LSTHPNGQGAILGILATLAMADLIFRFLFSRVVLLTLFTFILAGLLLSGSITGALTFAVGLIAVVLKRSVSPRTLMYVVFGALMFVFASLQLASSPNEPLTPLARVDSASGQTGESTFESRLETIRFARGAIADNPIVGVGLDDQSSGTFDGATAVHNMEVLAWFEGGILFFGGILLAISWVAALLWRSRGEQNREAQLLAPTCVAAFFVAQTGPVLYDRFLWIGPVLLASTATRLVAHR